MNQLHQDITYSNAAPSVKQYQQLYASTGWAKMTDHEITKALSNSLFFVSALDNEQLVGMLRVVGDGSMYFYIQDVVVDPSYQKRGIAREMMNRVMDYLNNETSENSFIGLMAAEGAKEFYKPFGFVERGTKEPGMHFKKT